MADETKKPSAVYVGWATFKNALATLSQGIPNVVDKTAFIGLAGGVQSQLIAGMKFLALIDQDGKPLPALEAVAVKDEAAQKAALRTILTERYAALFALDLQKTTFGQLSDTMADAYSVTGDTKERAVRFFLQAAKYSGVPVSQFLLKASNSGSNGIGSRRRGSRARQEPPPPPPPAGAHPPPAAPAGTSRTVELKSGGTLTVSASMDVFALDPEDRVFVFDLIDRLRKYESEKQTAKQPAATSASVAANKSAAK